MRPVRGARVAADNPREETAMDGLGRAYFILSNIYMQVPGKDFSRILEREILPSLSALGNMAAEKGWTRVLEALRLIEEGASGKDLAGEFTKLFRGVRPGYGPKPPYESLYRGEKTVMGDIAGEVKRRYREAGLSLEARFKGEPPDHISFELFFLSHLHLLEQELRNERKGQDADEIAAQRRSFVNEHASRWMPAFCDVIIEAADTTFYKGVASLTREMLLLEQW